MTRTTSLARGFRTAAAAPSASQQLLQILAANVPMKAVGGRKTKTATEIVTEIRAGNMTATEVLGGCSTATFEYFLA